MKNTLQISIGQYSDKGVKEINQDFHDIRIPKEPQLTTKGIAIALADGISSSTVSQIASKTAVTSFLNDYFSTPESWSVKKSAECVLKATNSWLYSQSKQGEYSHDKDRGYVCTFSSMIIRSSTAHIFHLGDSRVYRLRDNQLEQLTDDHRIWISSNQIYLGRALGIDTEINLQHLSFQVELGDIYFFMVDGIYDFVGDSLFISTLKKYKNDLKQVATKIADIAYNNGSDDNLTIQLVRVDSLASKDVNEIYQDLKQKPFPPILEERMEFDGYSIVRVLSSNSRSHVYLALDNETNISVVLKAPSIDLQSNKAYLERFMMEEWVAIRINNINVAKSYLQTRKRNFLYIVSEYIEGQTLTQWMIDNPNPEIETVRLIAEQIARGLQSFHRLEMLYQDLRPANILIDKNGIVKIIDFGATRIEGILDIESFSRQESLQGTAQYSAPEYFLGEQGTSASDVFSLAVIVYQMLSGKFPYGVEVARSTSIALQKKLKYAHLYSEDNAIPIWIEETLKKGLEPDPYNRYSELSEFIYDLRHPNESFLNKTRPPLSERNPILLWKSIFFKLWA